MKRLIYKDYFCLFIVVFFTVSCDKYTVNPDDNQTDLGKIKIGSLVEVSNSTIGINGGTIRIDKPGTAADGIEIVIPPNSFSLTQTFKVSFAEIRENDMGPFFNPISPLIRIEYNGGYADDLMSVTIPVVIPAGHIPIGLFYDEITGKLEGIPFQDITTNSITLLTRHFMHASSLILGESSLKSNTANNGRSANIIISSIAESVLKSKPIIASGFLPGIDDWEFTNYGSYLAPGGHCAGQNMAAMWYYFEKKPTEGNLNGKFSNNPNLWMDNAIGYRWCSVIQKDSDWDNPVTNFFWKHIDFEQNLDYFKMATIATMILMTGEPQAVSVWRTYSEQSVDKISGHALICYQVSLTDGTLYVSDPNTPGEGQSIQLKDSIFEPYMAKLNGSDANDFPFPYITYYAKTAVINWQQIESRYKELKDSTIGTIAPNAFPDYDLIGIAETGDFSIRNGMIINSDTLRVKALSEKVDLAVLVGTEKRIGISVYNEDGIEIHTLSMNGDVLVSLKPGLNLLGFYFYGWKEDYTYTNGEYIPKYIDFKWITLVSMPLMIDPNPLFGETEKEYRWTALTRGTAPVNATYVWNFGDGSGTVSRQNDSTVVHTYHNNGDYAVNVELLGPNQILLGQAVSAASIKTMDTEGTFEYQGKEYHYKTIGTQTWMTENLAYLPAVYASGMGSSSSLRYYVYGYDEYPAILNDAKATANYTTYGVLYNWPAAQNACPPGWHLPSVSDWEILASFLGPDAARKLRSTSGWQYNMNGDGSSGFNALPAGYRMYGGGFWGLGSSAEFWSNSMNGPYGWGWHISVYSDGMTTRELFTAGSYELSEGASVRCIRNQTY